MKTRIADHHDEEVICRLLFIMAEEVALSGVDWYKVYEKVCSVIDGGKCLILEDDGKVIGSVGLEERSWWYSRERYVGDYWFFVHPNYRQTRGAVLLKQAALNISELPVILTAFTLKDTERKDLFFSRGMTPMGQIFIKENPDGIPLRK